MKIEIMAPAGSFETLNAGIKAGADSIYFGVGELNMRSSSANFKLKDMKKIIEICKKNKVRSYLTLNTIIYDNDIGLMKEICQKAKEYGISAVIACDVAVMEYARSINLEVHSSTQLNVSNFEAVKFYSKFADVIVLARELKLKQIRYICKKVKEEKIKGPKGSIVKIEIFCHGALCVSISGKCYMSLAVYNKSANRGACLQNCRRSYRVIDEQTGEELKIENKYVMSPKDLCTIKFLDKIIKSGVSVLKIEGRARSADYVYSVTKVYKEGADAVLNNTYSKDKVNKWLKEISSVYNRGFWHGGYYLGKKLGEWAGVYGSKAKKEKKYVGKIVNYFVKVNVAEIKIENYEVKEGGTLLITGPTTGALYVKLDKILKDDKEVEVSKKGERVTIKVPERVRKNDKAYVLVKRK